MVERQKQVVAQLPETPQKGDLSSAINAASTHLRTIDLDIGAAANSLRNTAPLNQAIQQQLSTVKPLTRQ